MARAARSGPYVCGIDAALDVVNGKWKGLILWELDKHGVRRFAQLRRGLPGVSEKMLTQHLREMEEDALVHREVYAEVPPRVEYSLTAHGHTLNRALDSLGAWGTERIRRERPAMLHPAEADQRRAATVNSWRSGTCSSGQDATVR
ncbi:helix-turn-helix domain-containing protein [Streptomyces sp. NPDC006632]|uniref:winged helix-turn-helix transcriptional regulator n=1 Tax=unclassified Streptomyces TaxID=2593676 RepID=UPI002E223A68